MTIFIYGFGDFGKLLTRYLSEHARVLVYDRHSQTDEITQLGAEVADVADVSQADVVIVAVTLDRLEASLTAIAPHLKPAALVADVTSVKVKPAEMMQRLLPQHVQILATHPLFGPVSAADSLLNHKVVIDPIRVNDLSKVEAFLKSLGLITIQMTCDEHDREMAWVHALTFFVGRGLLNMDPPASPLATHYYNELLDVVNVERTHSRELFNTIQQGNPYAAEMRQRFIASLQELQDQISS